MGVCLPNFRSVLLFVWPGDTITQINKYTHTQVKLRISSTGCSPNVDFDTIQMMPQSLHCIFFRWRVSRSRGNYDQCKGLKTFITMTPGGFFPCVRVAFLLCFILLIYKLCLIVVSVNLLLSIILHVFCIVSNYLIEFIVLFLSIKTFK